MKSETNRNFLLLAIALVVSYALAYFARLDAVWDFAWRVSGIFNGQDLGTIIVLVLVWTIPILIGELIIRFSRYEMGSVYFMYFFIFYSQYLFMGNIHLDHLNRYNLLKDIYRVIYTILFAWRGLKSC